MCHVLSILSAAAAKSQVNEVSGWSLRHAQRIHTCAGRVAVSKATAAFNRRRKVLSIALELGRIDPAHDIVAISGIGGGVSCWCPWICVSLHPVCHPLENVADHIKSSSI